MARTLVVVALAAWLSVRAVASLPSAPAAVFERNTSEGIGISFRMVSPGSFPETSGAEGEPCPGERRPEVMVRDRRGSSSGATAVSDGPDDLYGDPAGLLRVVSWSGATDSQGRVTFAFTLARVAPTIARIRASFPGGATDEMIPVKGWAAVAVRVGIPASGWLDPRVEGLDPSGRVIAAVGRTSSRYVSCL